jgi:hypothetical protein
MAKTIEEILDEIEKMVDSPDEETEEPEPEPKKEEPKVEAKKPAKSKTDEKLLEAITSLTERMGKMEERSFLSTPAGAFYAEIKRDMPEITPEVAVAMFTKYNKLYAGEGGVSPADRQKSVEVDELTAKVAKIHGISPDSLKAVRDVESKRDRENQYVALNLDGSVSNEDVMEVI